MKKLILAIALVLTMTTTTMAAELIMFSMASCGYCQSFLKEVAPTYAQSKFAQLLPLRIISMDRKAAPKWFEQAYDARKIDGIAGTPTFVVFENGEEKARLIGYQGKERFYEDMTNFIESNRKYLEMSAGKNPIPYEPDTEMNYKQAQIVEPSKVEGSHSQSVPQQQSPLVPFLAPPMGAKEKNSHAPIEELQKFPNGVVNSQDIRDHIYETETMAQIAANWLGCIGVHTHMIEGKTIYMPCEMKSND